MVFIVCQNEKLFSVGKYFAKASKEIVILFRYILLSSQK